MPTQFQPLAAYQSRAQNLFKRFSARSDGEWLRGPMLLDHIFHKLVTATESRLSNTEEANNKPILC